VESCGEPLKACAAGDFFLERSDNVIARRCLRDFSALFLLDMRPSNGVFM